VQVFNDTVSWYNTGITTYPGMLQPEVPEPLNTWWMKQSKTASAVFEESTVAWPSYLGT
jgi:hypothetical protein